MNIQADLANREFAVSLNWQLVTCNWQQLHRLPKNQSNIIKEQ